MTRVLEDDILRGMSMMEKVARFFVLIGEDSTVKIFQHLPKELVEAISTAITQISSINKDVSLAVLEEFHLYTRSKSFISSGGYDFAKDILYKSLGKEEADEVLAKLSRMKLASQAFAYLDGINPKQLSDFIKDESPHTIAVILAHMDPSKASEVLMQLDEEVRVKVTIQVATIKDVSPDVVRTISSVLEKKLESLLSSIVDVGGVRVVADMLNKMGPKAQDILKNINGIDTVLATKIKDNMFVFEDLLNLDAEYIMKILQGVESTEVAIAMKNTTEEQIEKVTSAMSQRVKERFLEESEMLTKVKIKDIEAAQRKMLDIAQKMIEEGIIERESN
ncbi:flagellar motor switch protein FliG [Aliarcobacter cibarius]|jgi:flagellar motor switch protein FliG|uniref:Flagellar motor switch protein FliG n=1 Tax=Aliarcobacter cibarius TaxID=255507 RepID=A0A5J6RFE5_9BACT|nr:flagellar motor switch protein FliG [Aliarcobacter cibarius]QEZ88542.1 flagellar motor switch C-ring protein FliG [Aliarcobacter cibarius]QKJ26581.1 flagellar motor switch C-ring protein FliG [Aliarcobacter cibarius]TLS98936.1 flagellar motor switch protein FliG [Aliarcobacter cibarius]TLS99852.1 flagellar motor switch protein FliG [Aliarcobacter cibarius]TLT03759.1 flagellar motor switch protein FliG [Aliarcobacter cibarius]